MSNHLLLYKMGFDGVKITWRLSLIENLRSLEENKWGRTGAVVRVADYGPRGPRFETWPGRRSLCPRASHIYILLSTG